MISFHNRIGAMLLVILIGLAALAATGVAAQEASGSLAIYAYACPGGIPSSDFSSCEEHPLGGVKFTAAEAGQDNGIGGETTADGDVSFPLSAIGGGTVNVHVSPPDGYETGYIACSQDYSAIEGGITLADVSKDGFITCQWYFVATSGDTAPDPTAPPAADPEPTAPPVSGLPETGSGPFDDTDGREWTPAILGVAAIIVLYAAHSVWLQRRASRRRGTARSPLEG